MSPPRRVIDQLSEGVARLVRVATARPRAVLALVLVVTLVLGAGATRFSFHNRFTDWVPDANEDKAAFDDAIEHVPGIINFEIVWLELDPTKTNATNVTDSEALRAQVELAAFVRERVPQVTGFNGPAYWVMLANYANHGNDPAHFRLPDTEAEMEAAREAAWSSNRDAMQHFMARDGTGAVIGFPIAEEPLTPASNDAGAALREAVAAYRDAEDLDHDIWKDAYLVPIGVPSSSGYLDEVAEGDIKRLGPVALLAIAAALLLAFHAGLPVVLALATVGLATLWVLGIVGWTGAELNLFNLAVFPLILGNGIDYAVHVLHEARSAREGDDPMVDPARLARAVGVPVVLVTFTTVLGLAAVTTSGSRYLLELGLWASAAMVVTALLALLFLPAAATLWPRALQGHPGEMGLLRRYARWARSHRPALAVVVILVTLLAAWSATHASYTVGLLEESFPEGDPVVRANQRWEEKTEGGDVAFVIYQGNVLDPGTLDHMARVADSLVAQGTVADHASVYDLPVLLNGYEAVESGPAGTLPHLLGTGEDRRTPGTEAEAREDVEAMYRSPIWHATVRNLVDRGGQHAVSYVLPHDTDDSLQAAAAHRDAVQRAVDAAGPAPEGVSVHVYGFKVMAHDFLEFSITWLWVLFAVTFTATLLLVAVLLRDARAVVAVAAPMVLSGIWWLGLLPLAGISVTIYLLVAVLFLTSIGSDYAAYLVWKARETGDLEGAFATTGRAVLFAAVTDGLAFLVFSGIQSASGAQMMLAAFLAIGSIFAATVLVLPLLPEAGVGGRGRTARDKPSPSP